MHAPDQHCCLKVLDGVCSGISVLWLDGAVSTTTSTRRNHRLAFSPFQAGEQPPHRFQFASGVWPSTPNTSSQHLPHRDTPSLSMPASTRSHSPYPTVLRRMYRVGRISAGSPGGDGGYPMSVRNRRGCSGCTGTRCERCWPTPSRRATGGRARHGATVRQAQDEPFTGVIDRILDDDHRGPRSSATRPSAFRNVCATSTVLTADTPR